MALISRTLSLTIGALAASSMMAMPSAAAELPQISTIPAHAAGHAGAYDGEAENADGWRRRRHRRGGIDAGDVIAGVVVLGAIAAIASSSSNRDRDRRREREQVRYREPAQQRQEQRSWGSGGIDSAVDMCVDQVERGRDQVESVDNASRDASGWAVSGSLSNGDYFSCRIDNEGRIRSIDMGDDFSAYEAPSGVSAQTDFGSDLQTGPQWSDEQYAAARANVRGPNVRRQGPASNVRNANTIDADLTEELRPAYPGGPLPGEEGYDEAMGG